MVNKNITKVCVGSIHDFPVSLGKTVKVNGKEIAVFKLSSGKIRAIENRCPHKGGVLSEGIVAATRCSVRCTTGKSACMTETCKSLTAAV